MAQGLVRRLERARGEAGGVKPKFTDRERFPRPYVRSEDMGPGYLREKFHRMQRKQDAADAEAAAKVAPITKRAVQAGNDRSTAASGDAPALGRHPIRRKA